MNNSRKKNIYYLENENGQVVRAIDWNAEHLYFVYRQNTGRIETSQNLSFYDDNEIPYQVIDAIRKSDFSSGQKISSLHIKNNLKLVQHENAESTAPHLLDTFLLDTFQPQIDDEKKFFIVLRNVVLGSICLIAVILVGSFFVAKPIKEDKTVELVQVIDRKILEKRVVEAAIPAKTPHAVSKKIHQVKIKQAQNKSANKSAKPSAQKLRQVGALGILGSLNSSKQKGGLPLDQIGASNGLGRAGNQGSGGIQTTVSTAYSTVYGKGLFGAPLGSGNNAQDGGGYGTKGKGGGKAGYGKLNLISSSKTYFEPVASEAWTDGGLDPNEIAAVIQRHISEVRACYEEGLQQKPNLSGRLSMKFLINASGSVSMAQVSSSSLAHPPVESCIRERLKAWRFPQPEGGVTVKVTYPFVLRRVSGS